MDPPYIPSLDKMVSEEELDQIRKQNLKIVKVLEVTSRTILSNYA